MTIDDVRRKSLRGIKDVSAYTANYDFSDCVYDAIQEMQTNSLCSRVEIRKRIGINGELSVVNVISGGSGYTYPPTVTVTDNIFTNAILMNGSTHRGDTASPVSVGTVHSLEFFVDSSDTQFTVMSAATGERIAHFNAGGVYYFTSSTGVGVTYNPITSGTKNHFVITRNGTSVKFFQNNVQIGTTQTLSANDVQSISGVGYYKAASTHFLSGYLSKVRLYGIEMDTYQISRQYNGGYGNSALQNVSAYFIYEFDGSGGTSSSTETDQSGNGYTLTLTGSPTRSSFGTGEPNATSKAVAEAIVSNGSVTSVVLTSPGIGYFSQPTITFTGGNGTGALAVAPISGTTFQKTITAKYSSSTSSEIPIECLYVDAMFKVGTDGTKTPIKLKDRYTVSAEKDTGVSSTSSEDLSGAILWDRNNIQIFTPWDMTDCTLEMWIRFQIPYVQDANVGTNANSYIDTIPVQFQNRLISGVKYHIYEAMEELSGFSGKYQPMMKVFGEQWFHRDLPYVKQEVNGTKAAETVHYVKPATVAGLE